TLHTNDTISTIFRLSNMGVPLYLLSGTLNLVIAQGLVRKICFNCIQSYNMSEKTEKELEKQFNVPQIIETMQEEGVISENQKKLKDILFYKGKGCEKCNYTGYKGRVGVYEVLENTEDLANLILEQAEEEKIMKQAREDGLISMTEDGFIKARNGITTIDEILRVTQR
ncbi:MAG TPA: ATPase, T2SS/T4P/T4SS family, partial [Patescibacteria group bacterium]|nr:ATPase, T2SS/T4P/T4SS family [Patescibacteria group bacterium]